MVTAMISCLIVWIVNKKTAPVYRHGPSLGRKRHQARIATKRDT